MRVLYPGHRYALANLKGDGETVLQFKQDAPLHPEAPGTSCQEVVRALIDRVYTLDAERPWHGNAMIIQRAREMLSLFEARALVRKAEKGLPVERIAVGWDGHFALSDSDGSPKGGDGEAGSVHDGPGRETASPHTSPPSSPQAG